MSDPSPEDLNLSRPEERWNSIGTIDIIVDVPAQKPSSPLPPEHLAWLRAERAKMAKWDPAFREQLRKLGLLEEVLRDLGEEAPAPPNPPPDQPSTS